MTQNKPPTDINEKRLEKEFKSNVLMVAPYDIFSNFMTIQLRMYYMGLISIGLLLLLTLGLLFFVSDICFKKDSLILDQKIEILGLRQRIYEGGHYASKAD